MAESLPPHFLDTLESFPGQIQRIKDAFIHQNYQELVEHASTTINYVYEQNLLLLALLDIRSHGHTMNGQYNEAYADAQKMTKIVPTSTAGYTRVGHLLSMYGDQISSTVGANNEDHSNSNNNSNFRVSPPPQQQQQQDHHHQTNPQPLEVTNNIRSLEISRQGRRPHQTDRYSMEETSKDSERTRNGGEGVGIKILRINTTDPLRLFPDGITKRIITLLPQNDRLVCIQVSKLWQKEILGCAEAWKGLKLEFHGVNDTLSIRLLNFCCDHVENLYISHSTTEKIQYHILKALQKRSFGKIQSFSLFASKNGIQIMDHFTADITNALYSIRNTLTGLNINFSCDYDINPTITIATILDTCRNLTDLVYRNRNIKVSTFIGNLTTLDNHRHLVNLELNAETISKQNIESIIQICRQLRRINVGNYCGDKSVLDMFLTQTATPNLEILGINSYVTDGVPQLTEKEDSNWREIGLRVLWITQEFSDELSVSYETKIFQLMHRNMKTLETINVTLPKTTTHNIMNLFKSRKRPQDYSDLNFIKIKSLTFNSSPTVIYKFKMDKSIRKSITLKHLELDGLTYMSQLADILLKMPPLERLSVIGRQEESFFEPDPSNSRSLNILFARYSSFSLLKSLHLEQHRGVSDTTLITVAGTKSLKKITFAYLHYVSTNGIKDFFYKIGSQLTNISLESMDCITDDVLAVLGEQRKYLSSVNLKRLDHVTDQGIKTLIDKSHSRLETLGIYWCKKTTENCKVDPERKIKYISYLNY
ncbi:hypothetical protein BDA99DRAFT_508172 [Phascolomyces articulosus]|uniref:F-box domain-containing protein n=1 Tax=Phascolomyces articulosus TaxID=60185 RepID=A0AAD5PGR7_9FUNG|nr:hypothetical protein BDA99DRAFT_508172 [Phascolomyces articulosus]